MDDTDEIDVHSLGSDRSRAPGGNLSNRATVGTRAPQSAEPFAGTDRFQVIRPLGEGGMGSVYEVHDRQTDRRVALKTLLSWGPYELYLFKQEFRRLRDVVHPNLVTLHELFADGDRWFFTMDLIRGRPFLEWVGDTPGAPSSIHRGSGAERAEIIETLAFDLEQATQDALQTAPQIVLPDLGRRFDRLRSALPQLVEGLRALHAVGILHRDIKPSNVLVTDEGRVIVLDFGLSVDLQAPISDTKPGRVHGTVGYMSPEQARGNALTRASDWYSVGVMLFEGMVGALPHRGSMGEILHGKLHEDPPEIVSINPMAPEDLATIAQDLLLREPERRPNGAEILGRLGVGGGPEAGSHSMSGGFQTTHRLALDLGVRDVNTAGREPLLARFQAIWGRAGRGEAQVLCVHGGSGMGKSSLLDAFADVARKSGGTVLRARCFERESVPFKALDPIVDDLAARLRQADPHEVKELRPRFAANLIRAFPVLGGIPGIELSTDRTPDAVDPIEQRRRAGLALRETLDRIADREPLLVIVDDLQWGDLDSAHLLGELLRHPDSPSLVLVLAWRTDGRPGHPVLDHLDPEGHAADDPATWALVEVGPLPPADAERVAAIRLEARGVRKPGLAASIAAESGGVPFFLDELVRYARERGAEDTARNIGELRLDDLLRRRVGGLPEQARQVLEVICVAGDARPRAVVEDAVGPLVDSKALVVLGAEQFVVQTTANGQSAVAPFHDRVREAVCAGLAPDRTRDIHLALARTITRYQPDDDDALAVHYLEAGVREEALHHARISAANAARQFAFDRAAALYARCLDLARDRGERESLLLARAEALAHGGKGIAAADAFLELAATAPVERARALEQRAADQLVRAGAIERGRDVLERVLRVAEMPMPRSTGRAILSFLWNRLRVTLRGLAFEERAPEAVDPVLLSKVDLSWSVSLGLSLIDAVRGADYQARNLLLALRAGEPWRVARSFAAEAAYAAAFGGRGTQRAQELVRLAGGLASRIQHPHALGMWKLCSAIVAFQGGRFEQCHQDAREAVSTFQRRCTDVTWELSTAWIYLSAVRLFLGQFDDFLRDHASLVSGARDRADLHSEIHIHLAMPIPHAALIDQPERGRVEAEAAWARWPDRTFSLLTLHAYRTLTEIALYTLDGAAGLDPAELGWKELNGSPLARVVVVRFQTLELRLRAVLGRMALGLAPPDAAETLRKGVAELRRSGIPWFQACAALIEAQRLSALGHRAEAGRAYVDASVELDAAGLRPHATAARVRAAQHGATTISVEGELAPWRTAGVVDPRRLVRMLAPWGGLP